MRRPLVWRGTGHAWQRLRAKFYRESAARLDDHRRRHPARAPSGKHAVRRQLMAEEGRPNTGRQLRRVLARMRREGRS